MKKALLFLAMILITGLATNSFAQKDRALKNGFSINLIVGLPAENYGLPSDAELDSDYKLGPLAGLQIGSRWYFHPGEKFGVGLMVNWFDITAALKTNKEGSYTMTRVVADATFLELGPVVTYKIAENLAVDGYYNLRPTGFATIISSKFGDESDSESYAGFAPTHAFGAAFRYNILSVGAEYVLGKVKCSNTDSEGYDPTDKFVANNIRIMIGVKF